MKAYQIKESIILCINSFIKRINNLVDFGVSDTYTYEVNSQTQLLNSGCLISIFTLTLNSLISYSSEVYYSSLFGVLFIVVLMMTLTLNYRNHIWKARTLMVTWFGVHVMLHAFFLGQFQQLIVMYLVAVIFCILLFESRSNYSLILGLYLIATYFVAKKLTLISSIQYGFNVNQTISDINFVAAIFLCILMIRAVLKSKKTYLDKILLLLKDIEQKNEELKIQNQKIQASNIELERFAYIASHDLKEPLRNITSFSTLLERKIKGMKEEPNLSEYLSFIKNNAIQMNHLIQEVLEYSRVDDRSNVELKETNLEELVKQVKNSILTILEENNVQIIIKDFSPNFYTNVSQLFLVFKNLIGNGIKYNKKLNKIIDISYLDKDAYHQFSIKDNGIGIDPKYQDQIFEMFKRLHDRQEYKGSGLGLAICKKIITNMKGEIWCESSEEGSVFYFTILKESEKVNKKEEAKKILKPLSL